MSGGPLEKLRTFPKENQEKKQLEEIAHLYFSTPAPSSKRDEGPGEPERRQRRPLKVFSPFPRALVVRCLAGQPESDLSTWFFFNLAVMLKILNGPVLLVGSACTYERRFLFGFRPDRERLRIEDGPRVPIGSFGPMGVCLLDGSMLWRGIEDEGKAYEADPMAAGRVAFRYILSDEVGSGGVFRSLPGLVVLLVTPSTTTPALLDRAAGTDGELLPGPGHAGIVVAGAGCAEEAEALHLYWREKLEDRYAGELAVENFGVLPCESVDRPAVFLPRPDSYAGRLGADETALFDTSLRGGTMAGLGILDDPESPQSRSCHTIAARIRKKRSQLVHGS